MPRFEVVVRIRILERPDPQNLLRRALVHPRLAQHKDVATRRPFANRREQPRHVPREVGQVQLQGLAPELRGHGRVGVVLLLRMHHRLRQHRVDAAPLLLQVSREALAKHRLQRPRQRRAHEGEVLLVDAVHAMLRAQHAQQRLQRRRVVEHLHRLCDHARQRPRLLPDVGRGEERALHVVRELLELVGEGVLEARRGEGLLPHGRDALALQLRLVVGEDLVREDVVELFDRAAFVFAEFAGCVAQESA